MHIHTERHSNTHGIDNLHTLAVRTTLDRTPGYKGGNLHLVADNRLVVGGRALHSTPLAVEGKAPNLPATIHFEGHVSGMLSGTCSAFSLWYTDVFYTCPKNHVLYRKRTLLHKVQFNVLGAYAHTYIRTHIHTHIHTYIYTYIHALDFGFAIRANWGFDERDN
jgi:hypothetical protein